MIDEYIDVNDSRSTYICRREGSNYNENAWVLKTYRTILEFFIYFYHASPAYPCQTSKHSLHMIPCLYMYVKRFGRKNAELLKSGHIHRHTDQTNFIPMKTWLHWEKALADEIAICIWSVSPILIASSSRHYGRIFSLLDDEESNHAETGMCEYR